MFDISSDFIQQHFLNENFYNLAVNHIIFLELFNGARVCLELFIRLHSLVNNFAVSVCAVSRSEELLATNED